VASPISLDGHELTLEQFVAIVRGGAPVTLAPAARQVVAAARASVERAVQGRRAVYGVNTGFGSLSDRLVPPEAARELQLSLLRSHASGAGASLPDEVVRGMILLRLNSLARGRSGVRPELLELLAELLNLGLRPVIPEQGSVGASGDLAPLAHLGTVLLGEGAFLGPDGRPTPAAPVLASHGLRPYEFAEKEGVALVNGTSLMAAYLALAVADVHRLLEAAEIAAALSFDALLGDPQALDDRLGELRRQPEHRAVAARLRALLAGSELSAPRREYRGQDPYTLRCLPQVLAAVQIALEFGERIVVPELGAVTDNPVVLDHDEFLSGGNFHGQSLALGLDTLALGVQYLTAFSERRTARLVHPALNRGLPPFLAEPAGLRSGYMIPQYLAAALTNEGATLVHPASASSLSTSADQEDFVSMGPWAGVKLRRMIGNAWTVLAIEWVLAGEALEHRRPARGGVGSERALRELRRLVAPLERDRPPAPDLERVAHALADGTLIGAVLSDLEGWVGERRTPS
jgi:histidine ammonia-lyase